MPPAEDTTASSPDVWCQLRALELCQERLLPSLPALPDLLQGLLCHLLTALETEDAAGGSGSGVAGTKRAKNGGGGSGGPTVRGGGGGSRWRLLRCHHALRAPTTDRSSETTLTVDACLLALPYAMHLLAHAAVTARDAAQAAAAATTAHPPITITTTTITFDLDRFTNPFRSSRSSIPQPLQAAALQQATTTTITTAVTGSGAGENSTVPPPSSQGHGSDASVQLARSARVTTHSEHNGSGASRPSAATTIVGGVPASDHQPQQPLHHASLQQQHKPASRWVGGVTAVAGAPTAAAAQPPLPLELPAGLWVRAADQLWKRPVVAGAADVPVYLPLVLHALTAAGNRPRRWGAACSTMWHIAPPRALLPALCGQAAWDAVRARCGPAVASFQHDHHHHHHHRLYTLPAQAGQCSVLLLASQ